MLLHPAILGLLVCEAISAIALLGAAALGVRIAAGWNPASGEAAQLERERRADLVSLAVGFALALQILGLFLLVETANRLHPLFTGAMCAAGVLGANPFGYPALLFKIAGVFAGGVWLLVHRADAAHPHRPLLRIKFAALPAVAAIAGANAVLLVRYAGALDPEIITSCCSVLFDADGAPGRGVLPQPEPRDAMAVFFAGLVLLTAAGGLFLKSGRGAAPYGAGSAALFVVSLVAVVAFISPCWYRLPTHHCPFCLLQPEFHGAGHLLYAAIFVGGILGAGTGALSLAMRLPARRDGDGAVFRPLQKRLCSVSLAAFAVAAAMAAWPLIFSGFRLDGY